MTGNRGTEPLVSGLKKAVLHFSKAALEVASGVGDIVAGITGTLRPHGEGDDAGVDGPHKIDVE